IAVAIGGYKLLGEFFLGTALVLVLFSQAALFLEIRRRMNKRDETLQHRMAKLAENIYTQMESFVALNDLIKPKMPLPPLRKDWAPCPDFLKTIAAYIYKNKPRLVLEAGSGASTLVIAYCLTRLGGGRLVSLEHEKKFCSQTEANLHVHDLDKRAEVLYTPLKQYDINGKKWLWYEIDNITFPESIDLFIIDGPPQDVQDKARYPALPLLFQRLKTGTAIIMDDGNRKAEREIVKLWLEEFKNISAEYIDLERGAYILRIGDK
ncbi:MAG: class I SAM-dependent methyltransferase, partial [Candidatus Aminicenantes bacterium]|nr:class I SAM-dependent methyltransferase [Candidatus Aminicenantes bacterium]